MTSRTYAQFCALGMDGPYTAPFTFEHRAPRDTNPSGNYYASRGEFEDDLLGVVIHITAGLTDLNPPDLSAEGTDAWGRNTSTASWPGIVDSDSIINSLHPKRVAFLHGVPGYNFNRALYGFEIGKRDTDWNKMPQSWVDATLKNAAAYVAPIVIKHNIPLRVVTDRDEIQRRINRHEKVGFTEHWRLTPETRSDAGRIGNITTFPWERFFMFLRARIAELTNKPAPAPKPSPTPTTIRKGTVLAVVADRLNTRTGPGMNYPVVGGADKGVRVRATGKVNGPWIQAQTKWQREHKQVTWWHSGWLRVVSQPAPKPVPKPKPSTLPRKGVYVVRSGDTLSEIAARYKTSVRALQFLNGIDNPNRIERNQRIYVGWVVSSGQTLGGIADAAGTTVSKLVSINNISDPDKIEVGQVVRLP